jgi:RNase H-fold protein (predicted Holliday junction resolvase)
MRCMTYLGFDPGRQKCGVAIVGADRQVQIHQIVAVTDAIALVQAWVLQYGVDLIVLGDQTASKQWQDQIRAALPDLEVVRVDERYSSLQARDRYWQMFPPRGLVRLLPIGLREPPRPVDDIVAILLVERYLDALTAPLGS